MKHEHKCKWCDSEFICHKINPVEGHPTACQSCRTQWFAVDTVDQAEDLCDSVYLMSTEEPGEEPVPEITCTVQYSRDDLLRLQKIEREAQTRISEDE